MDKLVARAKNKRKKMQIINTKNERDITTNPTAIKIIIKEYHEQFYDIR